MQIDPRPYQAQLEQAEANKAKDQANLENAQRNLARYAAIVSNQMAVTRQRLEASIPPSGLADGGQRPIAVDQRQHRRRAADAVLYRGSRRAGDLCISEKLLGDECCAFAQS